MIRSRLLNACVGLPFSTKSILRPIFDSFSNHEPRSKSISIPIRFMFSQNKKDGKNRKQLGDMSVEEAMRTIGNFMKEKPGTTNHTFHLQQQLKDLETALSQPTTNTQSRVEKIENILKYIQENNLADFIDTEIKLGYTLEQMGLKEKALKVYKKVIDSVPFDQITPEQNISFTSCYFRAAQIIHTDIRNLTGEKIKTGFEYYLSTLKLTNKNPTFAAANVLIEFGKYHRDIVRNPKEACKYFRSAMTFLEEMKWIENSFYANAFREYAITVTIDKQYAPEFVKEAETKAQLFERFLKQNKIAQKEVQLVKNIVGIIPSFIGAGYYVLGQFTKSITHFQRSQKYFQEVKLLDYNITFMLCNSYTMVRKPEKKYETLEQMFNFIKTNKQSFSETKNDFIKCMELYVEAQVAIKERNTPQKFQEIRKQVEQINKVRIQKFNYNEEQILGLQILQLSLYWNSQQYETILEKAPSLYKSISQASQKYPQVDSFKKMRINCLSMELLARKSLQQPQSQLNEAIEKAKVLIETYKDNTACLAPLIKLIYIKELVFEHLNQLGSMGRSFDTLTELMKQAKFPITEQINLFKQMSLIYESTKHNKADYAFLMAASYRPLVDLIVQQQDVMLSTENLRPLYFEIWRKRVFNNTTYLIVLLNTCKKLGQQETPQQQRNHLPQYLKACQSLKSTIDLEIRVFERILSEQPQDDKEVTFSISQMKTFKEIVDKRSKEIMSDDQQQSSQNNKKEQ